MRNKRSVHERMLLSQGVPKVYKIRIYIKIIMSSFTVEWSTNAQKDIFFKNRKIVSFMLGMHYLHRNQLMHAVRALVVVTMRTIYGIGMI